MIDYILLGKRIQSCRKAAGLTQARLAERIGVSPNHISKIETGATKLSLQVFVDIADAVNVPLDHLMFGNLAQPSPVYAQEMAEALNHCTPKQKMAFISIVQEIHAMLEEAENARQV